MQMRKSVGKALLVLGTVLFLKSLALADNLQLDYPHSAVSGLGCASCHYVVTEPPAWLRDFDPQTIDDTLDNTLCLSCHNSGYPKDIPVVKTHSSVQTGNRYHQPAGWSIECKTCHWPHHQMQLRTHGPESYVFSGVSTEVTASGLKMAGANWSPDRFNNYLLIPNVHNSSYSYEIEATSSDTLTVDPVAAPIDLTKAGNGDTFAVVYGKLIKSLLPTPASGDKPVRFFGKTGARSYADGDSAYDGVCEVCHTQTSHFRNDGTGLDQNHSNVGGGEGKNCLFCHRHQSGFAHGGGAGGGGCESCHGHDDGFGGAGTGGKGTYLSHSTHTENDADDLKGPNLACGDCHNTSAFPNFKDGHLARRDHGLRHLPLGRRYLQRSHRSGGRRQE